jgi:heme/copper-type cytochrome/quinol oxidase subunit 2
LSKKQWFFGILIVLAGAVIVFAPLPVHAAQPAQRTYRVEASQFAYAPAVIEVNPGDTVTIELVSTDVVHGLYLDGYGVSVTADPGQTARLTFTADKSGSFRFRCNVTCGALHPFMIGKLQVGPNTWLWRAIALTVLAAFATLFFHPNLPKAKAG